MSSEDGSREEVYRRLSRDITSCDFLLSVFWAAMTSYRHDTVLRPFPPGFVLADNTKDVEALVSYEIDYKYCFNAIFVLVTFVREALSSSYLP